MEAIRVSLTAEAFDAAVHHPQALPEAGDLEIAVKPGATTAGKAGVVITFGVQLPDGTMARAQAVTTATAFLAAAAAVRARHPNG